MSGTIRVKVNNLWFVLVMCLYHELSGSLYVGATYLSRDHFVYAPSQWEMALHCNTISHSLGACAIQ